MDNRPNKMLIDATHPEETRVVVLRNGRVEEFDFESASKKPLRGNIYLAKVTRVEPSLQAAFVEYGGNRHGFLPFNEIHPDYYQIPLADRQALLEEEMADMEADREDDERGERYRNGRHESSSAAASYDDRQPDGEESHDAAAGGEDPRPADAPSDDTASASQPEETGLAADAVRSSEMIDAVPADDAVRTSEDAHASAATEEPLRPVDHIEEVPATVEEPEIITGAGADAGTVDAMEEVVERPRRQRRRQYKIQEVIKRRQIMLVQVVKEERGTKGAALTTYLSLAGRYTVLMPNTGSGGGISRKITQPQDRKRLKEIARELDVPEGMGLIIRTAGAARTTQEIRRDYEYELRLWESIREVTLASTAPSLVYEEGDLIKRSIRDLYSKDIDEIVVAGQDAHREAQDFMRMLMPSHVKNVALHKGPEPLFSRYPAVDRQLNAMFSPHVQLKSGGYLVINQTEALVAIDINSGKSTREFSIEDTATNTNIEAADEIARQLRLRDLAGLIVIDFIDMEEKRNIRNVERRLKDALRHDRARIQVGRISHFGLLEMSRQRMRTGVLEGSTSKCPHCEGTGIIRSVESVTLAVLRGLEDYLMRDQRSSLLVQTNAEVALYILNHKRSYIIDLENRYGVSIHVQASDKLHGANFQIERSAVPPPARRQPTRAPVNMNSGFDGLPPEDADSSAEPIEEAEYAAADQPEAGDGEPRRYEERPNGNGESGDGRRRRRRRRGRRGRDGERFEGQSANGDNAVGDDGFASDDQPGDAPDLVSAPIGAEDDDQPELMNGDGEDAPQPGERDAGARENDQRRRRRGRRGGRRGRERDDVAAAPTHDVDTTAEAPIVEEREVAESKPSEPREVVDHAPTVIEAPEPIAAVEPVAEPVVAKPEPLTEPLVVSTATPKAPKTGWWRNRGLS